MGDQLDELSAIGESGTSRSATGVAIVGSRSMMHPAVAMGTALNPMLFFNKNKKAQSPEDAAASLRQVVQTEMNDADDATVRIVSAVAGLLAAVAYADRVFAPEEVEYVRGSISRINGMTPQATNTICGLLSRHMAELSTLHTHEFTRDLKELTEPHVRLEILDVMVDLAAADGEISLPEVNLVRQLTTALGLSQEHYNASQARHRDKLATP